eukprot:366099-Chlamydomonas_euryale.AAC.5
MTTSWAETPFLTSRTQAGGCRRQGQTRQTEAQRGCWLWVGLSTLQQVEWWQQPNLRGSVSGKAAGDTAQPCGWQQRAAAVRMPAGRRGEATPRSRPPAAAGRDGTPARLPSSRAGRDGLGGGSRWLCRRPQLRLSRAAARAAAAARSASARRRPDDAGRRTRRQRHRLRRKARVSALADGHGDGDAPAGGGCAAAAWRWIGAPCVKRDVRFSTFRNGSSLLAQLRRQCLRMICGVLRPVAAAWAGDAELAVPASPRPQLRNALPTST